MNILSNPTTCRCRYANYEPRFKLHVEDLLKKYGKKVRTIIPVHFAGNPVKMNKLKISEPYNCFILEDAAHALESIDDGNKIGDTDHAAAFSFYANKNITTGGEGGAIATNDSKISR